MQGQHLLYDIYKDTGVLRQVLMCETRTSSSGPGNPPRDRARQVLNREAKCDFCVGGLYGDRARRAREFCSSWANPLRRSRGTNVRRNAILSLGHPSGDCARQPFKHDATFVSKTRNRRRKSTWKLPNCATVVENDGWCLVHTSR